jgi:hypothetical protein
LSTGTYIDCQNFHFWFCGLLGVPGVRNLSLP